MCTTMCQCVCVCGSANNFIESLEIHSNDIFEILHHDRAQYVDKIRIGEICQNILI